MGGKRFNLKGMKFGRLLVLDLMERKSGSRYWGCLCDCGNYVEVSGSDLISGKTQSCNCLRIERISTHGLAGKRVYIIWKGMMARCYNPKHPSYKWYGKVGVLVEKRWHNPILFYKDLGDPPPGKTLERVDVYKGYSRKNCVWADYLVQGNNRRNTKWVTYEEKRLTISEWARFLGLNYHTLLKRFKKGYLPPKLFHNGNLAQDFFLKSNYSKDKSRDFKPKRKGRYLRS